MRADLRGAILGSGFDLEQSAEAKEPWLAPGNAGAHGWLGGIGRRIRMETSHLIELAYVAR